MIRLAVPEDLPEIDRVVNETVAAMNEAGNYQWDNKYPLLSHFEKDIAAEELYICHVKGKAAGVTCISEKGHEEYPEIAWTFDQPALTIKRTAVRPSFQGQGIATSLYAHAETVASSKKVSYIKTDTFSKNVPAQRLFYLNGYQYVAEKVFPEKEEKILYFEKMLGNH